MKYYAITCKDFQSQTGEFNLVTVQDGIVYVSSETDLAEPFKLSGLPEEFVANQKLFFEKAKELKKQEIDNAKIAQIENGVEFEGKVYQSAEYDRNLLTSTVSLFAISKSVPEGFVWISKDNEQVPFTLEKLMGLAQAMATDVQVQTIKARNLKDTVEKAKTIDEVNAIKFE